MIVWQQGGTRLVYDLMVRISSQKLDNVRQQIAREFPDEDISVTFDNDTAFVRGSVKDTFEAARIMAISATLGKAVNLLRVDIPVQEAQILLKVRFADVDRSASQQLGMNLASNAFNTTGGISTGQFGSSGIDGSGAFSLSDALNVLLFSKSLNLGVTIEALQSKNQLQMLAEPNVMATNGKPASFIAGGQFPVPSVQAGANSRSGQRFLRALRNSASLSAADYAARHHNACGHAGSQLARFRQRRDHRGHTVPALTVRRIDTVVELEPGRAS